MPFVFDPKSGQYKYKGRFDTSLVGDTTPPEVAPATNSRFEFPEQPAIPSTGVGETADAALVAADRFLGAPIKRGAERIAKDYRESILPAIIDPINVQLGKDINLLLHSEDIYDPAANAEVDTSRAQPFSAQAAAGLRGIPSVIENELPESVAKGMLRIPGMEGQVEGAPLALPEEQEATGAEIAAPTTYGGHGVQQVGDFAFSLPLDPGMVAYAGAARVLAKAGQSLEVAQKLVAVGIPGADKKLQAALQAHRLAQQVDVGTGVASLPGMAEASLTEGTAALEGFQKEGLTPATFGHALGALAPAAMSTAVLHDVGGVRREGGFTQVPSLEQINTAALDFQLEQPLQEVDTAAEAAANAEAGRFVPRGEPMRYEEPVELVPLPGEPGSPEFEAIENAAINAELGRISEPDPYANVVLERPRGVEDRDFVDDPTLLEDALEQEERAAYQADLAARQAELDARIASRFAPEVPPQGPRMVVTPEEAAAQPVAPGELLLPPGLERPAPEAPEAPAAPFRGRVALEEDFGAAVEEAASQPPGRPRLVPQPEVRMSPDARAALYREPEAVSPADVPVQPAGETPALEVPPGGETPAPPPPEPPEWHSGRYVRFGGDEMVTISRNVPEDVQGGLRPYDHVWIGEHTQPAYGSRVIRTQVPARELIAGDEAGAAPQPNLANALRNGGEARWVPAGMDPGEARFSGGRARKYSEEYPTAPAAATPTTPPPAAKSPTVTPITTAAAVTPPPAAAAGAGGANPTTLVMRAARALGGGKSFSGVALWNEYSRQAREVGKSASLAEFREAVAASGLPVEPDGTYITKEVAGGSQRDAGAAEAAGGGGRDRGVVGDQSADAEAFRSAIDGLIAEDVLTGASAPEAEVRKLLSKVLPGERFDTALQNLLAAGDLQRIGSTVGFTPQGIAKLKAAESAFDEALEPTPVGSFTTRAKVKIRATGDKARDRAAKRLKRMGRNAYSGVDFVEGSLIAADVTIWGASRLLEQGMTFTKWSNRMVKEFGAAIKPHLERMFAKAHEFLQWQQELYRPIRKKDPSRVNYALRGVVARYAAKYDLDIDPRTNTYAPFSATRAMKIADAFAAMQHNPNDPRVRASYEALIEETLQQWDFLISEGYTMEPWKGEGQPYFKAPSADMRKDVRENKHLWFFTGGDMPADHPLAAKAGRTVNGVDLTVNDIFRAIHDTFAHAKEGFEFGQYGEEAAWNEHYMMFTPAARPAMTTETRGQNSWVNFGRHLRTDWGKVPQKGEPGFVKPEDRPYAEQKAGLLPEEFISQKVPRRRKVESEKLRALVVKAKSGKRILLTDLGEALQSYTHKRWGVLAGKDLETAIETAIEMGREALSFQLEQKNTGLGWYRKDITEMEEAVKQLYPETADPRTMRFFKYVVAATSGGNRPNPNLEVALAVWDLFKKSGFKKFPLRNPETGGHWTGKPNFGFVSTLGKSQAGKLQKLVDDFGIEGAGDWLYNLQTPQDLKKYGGDVTQKAGAQRGSYILGPKEGAFGSNLNGVFEDLTGDVWFARTYYRWMGTLLNPKTTTGLVGAPEKADLPAMQRVIGRLAEEFSLTTADVQAALWYYEKQLYMALGAAGEEGSYAAAAKLALAKRAAPVQRGLFDESGVLGEADEEAGGEAPGGRQDAEPGRGAVEEPAGSSDEVGAPSQRRLLTVGRSVARGDVVDIPGDEALLFVQTEEGYPHDFIAELALAPEMSRIGSMVSALFDGINQYAGVDSAFIGFFASPGFNGVHVTDRTGKNIYLNVLQMAETAKDELASWIPLTGRPGILAENIVHTLIHETIHNKLPHDYSNGDVVFLDAQAKLFDELVERGVVDQLVNHTYDVLTLNNNKLYKWLTAKAAEGKALHAVSRNRRSTDRGESATVRDAGVRRRATDAGGPAGAPVEAAPGTARGAGPEGSVREGEPRETEGVESPSRVQRGDGVNRLNKAERDEYEHLESLIDEMDAPPEEALEPQELARWRSLKRRGGDFTAEEDKVRYEADRQRNIARMAEEDAAFREREARRPPSTPRPPQPEPAPYVNPHPFDESRLTPEELAEYNELSEQDYDYAAGFPSGTPEYERFQQLIAKGEGRSEEPASARSITASIFARRAAGQGAATAPAGVGSNTAGGSRSSVPAGPSSPVARPIPPSKEFVFHPRGDDLKRGVPRLSPQATTAAGAAFRDTATAPTVGKPSPKRGEPETDINVLRISTDAQVRDSVARLVESQPDYFGKVKGGARGEARDWDFVRRQALKLGLDPNAVLKAFHRKGGFLSDIEVEQATIISEEVARRAKERIESMRELTAAGKVVEADAEQILFEADMNTQSALRFTILGARAEAARVLALANKLGTGLTNEERAYRSFVSLHKTLGPAFQKEFYDAITRGDWKKVNKLQAKAFDATYMQKVLEMWKAGILSGPKSHAVNFISTGAHVAAVQPLEAFAAGAIDAARAKLTGLPDAQRERFMGESVAMLRGAHAALGPALFDPELGLVRALRDIKDGTFEERETARTVQNQEELYGRQAIGSTIFGFDPGFDVGQRVRISFQMLTAADNFWKVIAESQYIHREAFRDGRRRSLSNHALEGHVKGFVDSYAAKLHPQQDALTLGAKNAAKVGTFQEDMPRPIRALAEVENDWPILGFVFPFKKTPWNIGRAALSRTPLGFIPAALAHRKGDTAGAIDAGAKAALGTVMMAALYLLADEMEEDGEFGLTGGGPADFKLLQNKRDTGWQPYSVWWKGSDGKKRYLSFQRLDPISSLMGMVADAREIRNEHGQKAVLSKAVATIQENVTNKTFLAGLMGASRAIMDPQRYLSEWFQQFESSAMPFSGFLGSIAMGIDPHTRKTDTAMFTSEAPYIPPALAARLPFVSLLLPPKKTVVGENVQRVGGEGLVGGLQRALNPFPISTERSGPLVDVQKEFDRIGWVPGLPSRDLKLSGGRTLEMSEAEYTKYLTAYNDAGQRLAKMIRSAYWKNLPDRDDFAPPGSPSKESEARKLYVEAKKRSRAALYQDPAFRRRAARAQRGLEP